MVPVVACPLEEGVGEGVPFHRVQEEVAVVVEGEVHHPCQDLGEVGVGEGEEVPPLKNPLLCVFVVMVCQ